MDTFMHIMWALIAFTMSITIYTTAYSIIGFILPPKKFKKTKNKYKYAFLIAARNEEPTIGKLVASIKAQDYPSELISIFVLAHNCTDNTAKVALEAGATVYEWNNKKKAMKGYALDTLLKQIKQDYATQDQPNGILNFDGYFIFDADNVASTNFTTEMNKAFNNPKYDAFLSYSVPKNMNNVFSAFVGIGHASIMMHSRRPKSHLQLAPNIAGPGYLVRSHTLMNGYHCYTRSDDFEMTLLLASRGHRITYNEAATFYEEHPITLRIMLRQRMAWAKGTVNAYLKWFPHALWGIIAPYHKRPKGMEKPKRNFFQKCENEIMKRVSSAEILVSYFPIWVISTTAGFIYPIVFIIINAASGGYYDARYMLFSLLVLYGTIYLSHVIRFGVTIIREHRKIKVHPLKILSFFIFLPLFEVIVAYFSVFAVVMPAKTKWKPIPHTIEKTIDDCEKEKTLAQYIYDKDSNEKNSNNN